MSGLLRHILLAAMLIAAPRMAVAETCTAEALGAAVDAAGSELRAFNAEAQPKINLKLNALKDKYKWSDAEYEKKIWPYLHDKRIGELDAKVDELLTKIDSLGRLEPGRPVTCAAIGDVQASASELLAVMRTKSAYVNEKIDRGLEGSVAKSPAVAAPTAATAPPSFSAPSSAPPAAKAPSQDKVAKAGSPGGPAPNPVPTREAPQTPSAKSGAESASSWSTRTAETIPPPEIDDFPEQPGAPYVMAPEDFTAGEDGYTIEEIQEASRGFFGTISTSLASVIEHAFRKSGRPTAYVLGTEGGGAVLAGVRYGEGTMYLRSGGTQKVYWHGPSIGYDLGADGSRTLFLIYRLREPEGIYRRFTGLDGTAYLVGGVGITFLKGGDVLMAPIRSGLGLRFGASLGYVRFTPQPTWNPF